MCSLIIRLEQRFDITKKQTDYTSTITKLWKGVPWCVLYRMDYINHTSNKELRIYTGFDPKYHRDTPTFEVNLYFIINNSTCT